MVEYKDINSIEKLWEKLTEDFPPHQYPEKLLKSIFYMAAGAVYAMMKEVMLDSRLTPKQKMTFLDNLEKEIDEFIIHMKDSTSKIVKH